VTRTARLAIGYAVGGLLVGVGANAFFASGTLAQWRSAATWFAGGVLAHDLLMAPVALVVGTILVRLVPATYRGIVQTALYVSVAVALAAAVLVSGRGRNPAIPSQQPLPYGRNLLVVLALIWGFAAAVALTRLARSHHAKYAERRAPARG
jgi:hypothetical protein